MAKAISSRVVVAPTRNRNRARARVLVVAIGALTCAALTAASSVSHGEEASRPAAPVGADGGRYDPDNVTGISQSMETLLRGNARYIAKDYPGAIDLYRKGITLSPRSPLGHYLLGEGHLAMNNLSEAEAAFEAAEELTDSRNPTLRGQVLFVVADVYERQKKWDAAKIAWETYAQHVAKHADAGGHPGSAAARLKVVEATLAREKQYDGVRRRIAGDKDAGASDKK